MGAATYPMRIDPGTSYHLGLRLVLRSDAGVDTPWPLDDVEFTMSLRDEYRGLRWILPLAATDGWVRVDLTPVHTTPLRAVRRYLYWIDALQPDGEVRRLLTGPLYASAGGIQ